MLWIPLITTIYFLLVFAISEYKQRADILDIAWGLGFILIAVSSILLSQSFTTRSWLILILVAIWGIRLAIHIFSRTRKSTEDYRYKNLKMGIKNPTLLNTFIKIYLPQLIFMLIVSLPISIAIFNPSLDTNIFWLDYLAIGIWLFGFGFETVSDIQLTRFVERKKEGKTKTRFLTSGLWKYSRHPNYFGEVIQWWAIFLIAVSTPFGIFAVFGPMFITYLITQVSGIPMLEKKYEKDKEFEEYKKRTPRFIPIKLRF